MDETRSSSAPSDVSSLGQETLAEFQELDRRVIGLWRIHHLIGSMVLLGFAGAIGIFLSFQLPRFRWWIWGAWSALAFLRAVLWFWYPARSFRGWGYRLDAKVLEIKSGIWFRTLRLLPLTRLQHVDLQRGPLERYFGLTSMILHTAGTHEANLVIPGLEAEKAVQLRDHLVVLGGDDGV